MKHFSEEELIAYQLHDGSDEVAISRHLESCPECADLSESIAETLRVFSAEPAPQPDLEHNWQRLRGTLSVLTQESRRGFELLRWHWAWPAIGFAAAALLLLTVFGMHVNRTSETRHNLAVNGHGSLTTQPTDPAIANHLEAAERLLTEVNNASGSLDDNTCEQAHDLLLKNAIYVRNARDSGDLAEASVLENFGRVLTTLDNEPPTSHSTWRLRLEMNTSGLLLDIRILRQNDDHSQGVSQ
jgi:anti-sigma factor ChrR (cupin superfamily)